MNAIVDLLKIFIEKDDEDGYTTEIIQRLCKDNDDFKRGYREVIEEINKKINK